MLMFEIKTPRRVCTLDITPRVSQAVENIGLTEGAAMVYVPHTTAAVTINEGADFDVQRDILTTISKLIPRGGDYSHLEGNADAHIKSTLVGVSVLVPVSRGSLILGTWQKVFFCEFDGPRARKFYVIGLPGLVKEQ
ncbi:YjbQ family protein [bacterium]|nr:MAG: YjbQ family protein [bacterium]